MKEKHLHAAMLGIAAVAVLYLLLRRSAALSGGPVAVVDAGQQPQAYPNSQPIQLGDITVGGSPLNLTYNQVPPSETVQVKGGDGCPCNADDSCTLAGIPTTVNHVPEAVLQSSTENFQSYAAKAPHSRNVLLSCGITTAL